MGRYAEIVADYTDSKQEPGKPDASRSKPGGRYADIVAQFGTDADEQTKVRGSIFDPLTQGLSLGSYDELRGAAAAVGALFTDEDAGDAYTRVRDRLRGGLDDYRERRPWVSMGAEAVGAVPTAVIPGLNVAKASNAGQAAWRGARAGALGGAAFGFNQGEGGLENRANDALTGGAIGAGLGAGLGVAVPAASEGTSRLVRALMDRVNPNAATKAGINRAAQKEIRTALNADDITPQMLAKRLREYGSDAAIVDGSDALRETGRQMVQFGSPGQAPLAALGRERGRQAASRIGGAFEEVLGKRPAPAALVEALKKRTQRSADRLYGEAKAANAGRPVETAPIVDSLARDAGAMNVDDLLARQRMDLPEDAMRREMAKRLTRQRGNDAAEQVRADFAGYRPDAPRPEPLSAFLRKRGFEPTTRDRGDLDAIIGTSAGRGRGMFRQGGFKDLDDAAERAFEAGYIQERSPRALLDALDDDLRGNPIYSAADEDLAYAWREFDDGLRDAADMQDDLTRQGLNKRTGPDNEPITDYDHTARVQTLTARRLRNMSQSADGGQRFVAGEARPYHDALVDALDDATDGKYSIARSQYAKDKKVQDAFDYGFGKAMAPGSEISFVRKAWAGMSKEEKIAARAGVRSWLGQKAASFRGARAEGRNVFRDGDHREKLKIVFGEEVTERLSKAMEGQEAIWLTDDALVRAGGSQTARNAAGRLNPDNQRLPWDMSFLGTAMRGAQAAANQFRKPNHMTRSLGPALAAQGSARDRLVQALIDAQARAGSGQRLDIVKALMMNAGVRAPSATTGPDDVARARVRRP